MDRCGIMPVCPIVQNQQFTGLEDMIENNVLAFVKRQLGRTTCNIFPVHAHHPDKFGAVLVPSFYGWQPGHLWRAGNALCLKQNFIGIGQSARGCKSLDDMMDVGLDHSIRIKCRVMPDDIPPMCGVML